jgi:hypothetical protein
MFVGVRAFAKLNTAIEPEIAMQANLFFGPDIFQELK